MQLPKPLGLTALLGGFFALILVIAFARTGWGPPGSSAYQVYQLLNRLMAITLLFMSVGWLGLALQGWGGKATRLAFIFSLVMAAATAAEFWLFTDQPYGPGGELRSAAFSAFSLAGLFFDLALVALGIRIWRSQLAPRWTAILLLLALPIDVVGFFFISPFFASVVFSFVSAWLLLQTEENYHEMGKHDRYPSPG